jgi:nucleoside-diphosphate-sugar epimerase
VLVTGAAGLLGGVLIDGLGSARSVRGIDARSGDRTDRVVDMRHLDQVTAAFAGVDTVIDLAANADATTGWDEVYGNNVPATLNTLEGARAAGVRRIVFASSNHVNGLVERDDPYRSVLEGRYASVDKASLARVRTTDPIRPDGPYGVGKALGEAAARFYAEEHGISILCLRIGTVNSQNRPMTPRHFSTFLSHRDLLSLVSCCLSAPQALRFGIYFGVSANRWRIWDLENARQEVGYEPVDDAEQWR